MCCCISQITHLQIHEAAFNGEHDDVEAFVRQDGAEIDIADKVRHAANNDYFLQH